MSKKMLCVLLAMLMMSACAKEEIQESAKETSQAVITEEQPKIEEQK